MDKILTALIIMISSTMVTRLAVSEKSELVGVLQSAISAATMDPNIAPTDKDGHVYVNASALFVNFVSVEEKSNSISISAAVTFKWNIPLSQRGYNSVSFSVTKSQDNIWTPKIVPTNCLNLGDWRDSQDKTAVDISNRGVATWRLFGSWDLACDFHVVDYPFDLQVCSLALSAITESKTLAFLRPPGNPICTASSIQFHPQWTFLGTNYSISVINGVNTVVIKFAMRRKSQFYVVSLILPTLFLALSGFAIFISPSDSDEKMSISFTVLLSFFVVFAGVSNSIPAISEFSQMPLIYWGLFAFFVLESVATVVAAIFLRLSDYAKNGKKIGGTIPKIASVIVRKSKAVVKRVRNSCCGDNRVANSGHSATPVGQENASDGGHGESFFGKLRYYVDIANRCAIGVYGLFLAITMAVIVRLYFDGNNQQNFYPDPERPGFFTVNGIVFMDPVGDVTNC